MKNPIKPSLKTEIVPILSLVLMVLFSILLFPKLPDQVATHWNTAGEVDRWSNPLFVVVFFPVFVFFIYVFMVFLPFIDPKKDQYEKFLKTYHIFKAFLVLILAIIFLIVLFFGVGYDIKIELWIPILIGSFFVMTGNYLGKVRYNWFFGIRNPWTLSSEEVWNKTHRFSGWIFILIGFCLIMSYFIPAEFKLSFIISLVLGLILLTFIYSYLVYRKNIEK